MASKAWAYVYHLSWNGEVQATRAFLSVGSFAQTEAYIDPLWKPAV